jgi:hypothetical protein
MTISEIFEKSNIVTVGSKLARGMNKTQVIYVYFSKVQAIEIYHWVDLRFLSSGY